MKPTPSLICVLQRQATNEANLLAAIVPKKDPSGNRGIRRRSFSYATKNAARQHSWMFSGRYRIDLRNPLPFFSSMQIEAQVQVYRRKVYEKAECDQRLALSAWRRSFCDCQFLSCQRQSDPPDVLSTGRSLRCGSLFHRNRSIHFSV